MQCHSLRTSLVVGATVAIAAAGACRSAASVVFDLPEKPAQPASARSVAPAPSVGAVSVDTTRPLIEATLDPDSALALLPRDGYGRVDWVAAVRDGVVRPRRSLPGDEAPPDMRGFGFDFVYKGQAPPFDAVFPHSSHGEWLRCETCHGQIYQYRNSAPPTMAEINQGESCGQCHRTVALPASACVRCHPGMGTAKPTDDPVTFVGDLVMARASDSTAMGSGFPQSVFPHWLHRVRYDCSTCHRELFELEAGSDTLTMAELGEGQACGRCHDSRSAFGLVECNRCHVAVQPDEEDSSG